MNAEISERHAAEIADAKHWHEHAPETKVLLCFRCGEGREYLKSRWKVGRYTCSDCGWHDDEAWRQGR